MPDDHSDVVPLLPIPNRTVKRVCANDSAGSRVKVGHRQANYSKNPPQAIEGDFFCPGIYRQAEFADLKMLNQAVWLARTPLCLQGL